MRISFSLLVGLLSTMSLFSQSPGSGYAVNLDGTDDFVRVASPYRAYTNELTVECWVNTDVIQLADGLLSQSTEAVNAAGTNVWLLGNSGSGNSFTFYVWDNGTVRSIGATSNLSNTGWHHVAGVISASEISIYVDGIKEATSGTGISTGINSNASAVMHIGHDSRYVNSVRMLDARVDEVRIWKKALTESEIRSWMCRKVSSSHSQYSNMVGYYKFDENAGTTAYDSLNTNNGILTNGPTHVLSGAAIGDESTSSYGSGNLTSVTETHSDGSSFKIDNFTGTPGGAHVYLVNDAPNSTTESLSGALESTRYYGTYVVGGTSPTHSITYDYTGNANITGGTESQAVLASRAENATSSWTKLTNSFDLNTSTDVITQCNVSDNQEYAGGFDTELQERPGSGYALEFDATTKYVNIPNHSSLNPSTEISLEAWINPDNVSTWRLIATKWYDSGGTNDKFFYHFALNASGKLSIYISSDGDAVGSELAADAVAMETNTWTHVAFTANATTGDVKLYKNGIQVGSTGSYGSSTFPVVTQNVFIGSKYAGSSSFDGEIDEVRIWDKELTQSVLQNWMCKKVTSSHTNYCNLISYYRFDENTGTTLTDYAGGNDGTLTNSPTYGLSGAPIGDESTSSYGSGNSTSVTETHSDGSSFKIDNFTGTPDGAHVYLVNEAPNSTTESLSGALESTRYYGTFVVGGTSPTHSVTYDYTGNTNITGGTEAQAVLTSRAENSTTSWTKLTNSFNLNTSTDVITQCNISTNQEYAGGFDAVLQERPGSGYALDFDGTNDQVVASTSLSGANGTWEAWVHSADWIHGDERLFGNGIDYGVSNSVYISTHNVVGLHFRLGGTVDVGNDYVASTASQSFVAGSWHHLAATWSESAGTITLKLYLDGVLAATNTSTYVPSFGSTMYIGGSAGLPFHDGKMDEVRIWNKALSQSEIQNWMCKKVTLDHSNYCNLLAYYRFDENTGTTAYDYTGNYNGTLSGGPTYTLSSAAIGDESTNSYGNGNSTSVTETHSDGSSFKIDNFTGTPDGAHVYLVNEAPNSTTESLSGALESTRYYGTFVVGGTSPTHTATYDYTGNTNITGGSEAETKLTTRADNSGTSWTTYSSYFDLDQAANTISKCGQTANKEYAAGFDNTTLQERPGSGYALSFDGTNDDVSISGLTNYAFSNKLAVEAWVYPTALANFNGIVTQATAGNGAGDFNFTLDITNSNVFRFIVSDGSSFVSASSASTANLNQWYHVAGVYDGSNAILYVNGVQVATTAFSNNLQTFNSPVLIGQWYPNSANRFQGKIDEVRIWNTSLTQAEVRENMCKKLTSSHSKYCNLLAYYRFDENTGSTLKDYTGNYNGAISGAAYALSGAAIGDESTYSYSSGNSTSVTETHSDGSSFKIDNFTGTPDGAHVYLVNEAPNSTTESLSGALESSRYYGTFVVGGTSPTHTVTYNYSGNTNITGGTESETKIATRSDNSGTSWSKYSSYFDLDEASNTIFKCGQSANKEYAAGFDNTTLQERPGSGYALNFDGSNDYVDGGSAITSGLDDFTLECWMYFDGGSNQWFLSFDQGGNYAERIQVEVNVGAIYFGWQSASNATNWTSFSGGTIASSTWYHIAVTNSSSSGKQIFVNGELEASNASTLSPSELSGTVKFDIGRLYHASNNHYFDGQLDEVRVWNKVLTQTEIRTWMNKKVSSSHPQYCSLLAYYPFDENTGTTANNYAGGPNGTISGATFGLSGAPVGDNATFATSVNSSTNLSLAHADGPQMNVDVTSGTADLIALYRVDEAPNVTTPPSGVTEISSSHYYGVKAFGSSSLVYEVSYNYNGHADLDASEEDSLKLCSRANNATASWTLENATLNTTSNTLTLGGQTGTQFIMGSSNINPLPIDLIDFYGYRDAENQHNVLTWLTASEINNDFFEVERLSDDKKWLPIQRTRGKDLSNTVLEYSLTDKTDLKGTLYYRLKTVDLNGRRSYSEVISIESSGIPNERKIKLYPNPAQNKLIIDGKSNTENLTVLNTMGEIMNDQLSIQMTQEDKIELGLNNISNGVYFILIDGSSFKIIKE